MTSFPRDAYAELTKAINDAQTSLREQKSQINPGAYQDLYRKLNAIARAQQGLGVEIRQLINEAATEAR